MCQKCGGRFLYRDEDNTPACLACGWREPSLTIEQATAEMQAVRAKSGDTDNYRRFRNTSEAINDLRREAKHQRRTMERYSG